MLGRSRWAGPGGSDRTVQRFVATVIPWATLFGVCLRPHIYRSEDVYLLVGDEVIVPTALSTCLQPSPTLDQSGILTAVKQGR
jgi:hypothetical protein